MANIVVCKGFLVPVDSDVERELERKGKFYNQKEIFSILDERIELRNQIENEKNLIEEKTIEKLFERYEDFEKLHVLAGESLKKVLYGGNLSKKFDRIYKELSDNYDSIYLIIEEKKKLENAFDYYYKSNDAKSILVYLK